MLPPWCDAVYKTGGPLSAIGRRYHEVFLGAHEAAEPLPLRPGPVIFSTLARLPREFQADAAYAFGGQETSSLQLRAEFHAKRLRLRSAISDARSIW